MIKYVMSFYQVNVKLLKVLYNLQCAFYNSSFTTKGP